MTEQTAIVLSLAVGVAWYCLVRAGLDQQALSPDGAYYLKAAGGERVPRPYALRWLLPRLLRRDPWPWRVPSAAALMVLPAMTCGLALASGLSPRAALAAGLLAAGLPGVVRFYVRFPVLVDPLAMVCALAAAVASASGSRWQAVVLALVAGAAKESAPVFAAAWVLDPWLLIGIAGAGWWRRSVPRWEVALPDWLRHPVLAAQRVHSASFSSMVLPWGACAVLFPLGCAWDAPTLAAALALALGYGQLVAAQDEARLYQWAAPAVCLVAARAAIDMDGWGILMVLFHFVNPASSL